MQEPSVPHEPVGVVGLPQTTLREELANAITHGIGLVLSVVGLAVLVLLAMTRGEVSVLVGSLIFGGTLVFMYTASTIYHGLRTPRLKRLWRILDHIAIYLLIAGTYTPFALLYFNDSLGWTLLCLEWGIALAGSVLKIFFIGRYGILSTLIYVGMGWLVVLVAKPLIAVAPLGCIIWMAAGGLCYTGGVVFYAWDRLPYNHAIWHLFVLAGSLCHYLALVLYL